MTSSRPPTPPAERGHWRRYAVMWFALIWLLAAFAVMLIEGARAGALVLAAELVVLGFVRAVSRAPGPYGITSRSRAFDVTILMLGGGGVAVLAVIASGLDPL
ncbi:DUF3017 domain-containing protein [Ruania halotolerans]|uniref:DUF3017 domain-containing protein n=1 Tax=Ruania halotolerans TaxID=2897773 RepID=UPI001E489604|nr:DUF3017 domain-containing protein [Ruania halotolerans]UFU05631.1 DUF3017 domain-containing protein [Ruania halotolerans]